jgi:hypothetical protein
MIRRRLVLARSGDDGARAMRHFIIHQKPRHRGQAMFPLLPAMPWRAKSLLKTFRSLG